MNQGLGISDREEGSEAGNIPEVKEGSLSECFDVRIEAEGGVKFYAKVFNNRRRVD